VLALLYNATYVLDAALDFALYQHHHALEDLKDKAEEYAAAIVDKAVQDPSGRKKCDPRR